MSVILPTGKGLLKKSLFMKYNIEMLGNREQWQDTFMLIPGLRGLIPDDHILVRIDEAISTSWIRREVEGLYSETMGRPSIDPESALRLMIAGFIYGIKHDRKLIWEAEVNMAIRWFCGFAIDEKIPDHSSLTRIRQRWGVEVFSRIFKRVVMMCADAGLLSYETVHVDSTLIRADVSWESIIKVHTEEVIELNGEEAGEDDNEGGTGKTELKSRTDPDASLTRANRMEKYAPCYKQHTAVDDKSGVIVDVDVTTGKVNEGTQLIAQVERVIENTGVVPSVVTADSAYGTSENYRILEAMGIEPVIAAPPERRQGGSIPIRRFKYDEKHHVVRCPGGKTIYCTEKNRQGWLFKSRIRDCASCSLKSRCVPKSSGRRRILIVYGYTALLRGRRKKYKDEMKYIYGRHRSCIEGRNGEAKEQHGLRRAARRGLKQVMIQAYLTAVVMNLKRLGAFVFAVFELLRRIQKALKALKTKFETIGWQTVKIRIVFAES